MRRRSHSFAALEAMDLDSFPPLRVRAQPTAGSRTGSLAGASVSGSTERLRPAAEPLPAAAKPSLSAAALAAAASAPLSPSLSPALPPATEPRSSPPPQREMRRSSSQAAVQPHGGLDQLNVRGRVPRLAAPSDGKLDAEQKRELRAHDRARAERQSELMGELARHDLPLVQLLMAEFAQQPCNLGTSGAMRLRFLELYGRSCHTKHAATAEGAFGLSELAALLQTSKPARELLQLRLRAMKETAVQLFSGAHRLGPVSADPNETLMHLRTRIFEEQRRSGPASKDLAGNSESFPSTPSVIWASAPSIVVSRSTMTDG